MSEDHEIIEGGFKHYDRSPLTASEQAESDACGDLLSQLESDFANLFATSRGRNDADHGI